MNIMLSSFEAMQRTSSNAIDVASLRAAREEMAKAETAFDGIEESIRKADEQQNKFNGRVRQGTQNAGSLWQKLKGVAATVGVITGTKKILNLSDDLASTTARLNLLVTDGGSVEALEQKIMASAQRSRSAYFDTSAAVAKLGLNAGNAFDHDMDQVIAFMEQVNKQFVIGGATAQEQSNAMIQLTQAMAAGALRGEELNSILDGAPGIARAIESYMGIAEGSIKEYAAQGLVTAEVVKNAMFATAQETNAKFESMPKTWAQIGTSIKNQALSIFTPILKRINEIGNSQRFAQVTDGIINGLAGIASVATWVLGLLIGGASFVVDNWSWLAPIILGVAGALGVYYGVQLAANTVGLIAKGIHVVLAAVEMTRLAVMGALTTATATQTAVQYGLNTALYACPLVWIIILIIALISVIYAVCSALAKMTGAANTGFGFICGGINIVIAYLDNMNKTAQNVFFGIVSALGACASNIGTAFHNVIAHIKGWFYDLLSTTLTVVEGICAALNKLPFIEFDYSGISAKAEEYATKSAEAYNSKEEFKSVLDAFREGMSTFDTFQDGWMEEAFVSGAAWGDGIIEKVSDLFGFSKKGSLFDKVSGFVNDSMANGMANRLDSIYNNTGYTAENTAMMSDSLHIAEEDLKYMRDIAEREAVNRYTTAEIKVEQHNENHISKDTDLDGVMDAWSKDFAQKLDISQEGVHE